MTMSSPTNDAPQARDSDSVMDTPASDVVDTTVSTSDRRIVPSSDARQDEKSKSSSNESLSHRDLERMNESDEIIAVTQVPMKKSDAPPRQPKITKQTTTYVSKFSYHPRPEESAYYSGLFAYVSSFLKNSGSKEVILPPKLVADKLFLSSKVSSDRLRVIWNMATAVIPDSGGGSTDEGSVASRSKNGVIGGKVIVMTQSQFNTAVRLIQLFQNRATATNARLTLVERKVQTSTEGAMMRGKLVKFDEDGLLPAYFAGVSGVYLAMPGTKEYNLMVMMMEHKGDMIPTKLKNGYRRRSVDDEIGALKRRPTVEMTQNERRMKCVEQELMNLRKIVMALHTEVRQLKAVVAGRRPSGESLKSSVASAGLKQAAINRLSQSVVVPTSSVASSGSKNGAAIVNRLNGSVVAARQRNVGASIKVQNVDSSMKMQNNVTNQKQPKAESLVTHQEADEDSKPNIGVECFWGEKEVPELEYPMKLAPSLRNKKETAKNPPVAKEVAPFDPAAKTPLNVSSNIPTMHPGKMRAREVASFDPKPGDVPPQNDTSPKSAMRKSTIQIKPKVVASLSSQGLPQARANLPSNLTKSESSAESNSMGSRRGRLASSLESNSSPNYPNQNGVKMAPGACRVLSASVDSNSNEGANENYVPSYAPVRRRPEPGESIYAAKTHRVTNGGDLRASLSADALTNITGNAHSPLAENGDTSQPRRNSLTKKKVAPARPLVRRLTKDCKQQSIRHIVRATDGTEREYKEKEAPRSTAAVDLKPLEPAPMTHPSILKNKEDEIKQKNKTNGWVKRLSSG